MRELYELRVVAEYADILFSEGEGTKMGHDLSLGRPNVPTYGVRAVRLPPEDPRLEELAALEKHLKQTGKGIAVGGFIIWRTYSPGELEASAWLHMIATKDIMTSGEECTTVYDETRQCDERFSEGISWEFEGVMTQIIGPATCTWGAVQTNLLALPEGKIPKTKDLYKTWADEWVVSQRFRDVYCESFLQSATFAPILKCGRSQKRGVARKAADYVDGYYQLAVEQRPFRIVPPTVVRSHVLQYEQEPSYVCPHGHVLGPRLISELHLEQIEEPQGELGQAVNGHGFRCGLFRPTSPLIVSQAFYRRWKEAGLKGAEFHVAHVS